MKRDLDLIRDMLFTIESINTPDTPVGISDFNPLGKSKEELFYHAQLLMDENFIEGVFSDVAMFFSVTRITNNGHDYLDAVRDSSIWNKTKATLGDTISSISLSLVKEIALKFIKDSINM